MSERIEIDDEDEDYVILADQIAIVGCNGDCAAHILLHDEDGLIFGEAAITHKMALELGEVLMRLGKSEAKPAGMSQRLHG